ncbi:MAG TPA: PEP-CTERM sorting domain-containing protein, partial [Pirellulaceae bacterium]|nr:PEP-CTERM sorting domain-containing protein [Pirellulaceae bacterium]
DDRYWNSATGGAFGNPGNWTPTQVPCTGDTAIFDINGSYTTLFGQNHTNRRLLIGRGVVTFDLDGNVYQLTETGTAAPSIVVGFNPGIAADLRILRGTLSGQSAMIGSVSGSHGTARVTGPTATWNNTGILYVGAGGQGTLHVNSGGSVTSGSGFVGNASTATGTATITGTGSSWTGMGTFSVGNNGQGTLNIQSGGLVSNTNGYIGRFSSSTGNATVTGAGSTWNNSGNLLVGGSDGSAGGTGSLSVANGGRVNVGGTLRVWGGTGTLNVIDQGLVEASNIVIDPTATLNWNNQGTLRVKGGTITGLHDSQNNILIGSNGGQRLELVGGATLDNNTGLIGIGQVVVSGAGSHWQNTEFLLVGNEGQASLHIEAGGLVTSSNGHIGLGALGSGMVTVSGNGSQWSNSSHLIVGEHGHGAVSIESGGRYVSNGETYLGWAPGSTGSLTVTGAGSEWKSPLLSVGSGGPGELTISNGGKLTGNIAFIGESTGSGLAIVTGSNSQWNVEEFWIGNSVNGTMLIEGGGKATSFRSYIGMSNDINGQVVVDGAGSQWTTWGDLFVGLGGSGALHVGHGGAVNSYYTVIGQHSGSQGVVTLSGAGSSLDAAYITISDLGSGALNILNGATVSSGSAIVGMSGPATVVVSGSGAQWNLSDRLEIGRLDGSGASIASFTIGPGGTVDVGGRMQLNDGATLNLHGGTLRLNDTQFTHTSASMINYLSGTLQLAGDRTIGTDAATTAFFGTSPNIGAGKHLRVEGMANLFAPVTLSGGTFSVGNLQNASLLNFQNGTFNLTGSSLNIGNGGMLGDMLEVNHQQTYNITQTATVHSDGALFVNNGGRFQSQILTNYGDIFLGGNNARITATAEEAIRNYGLVSGAGRIQGEFSNRAGGIVELEAGKRLTFTDHFANQQGARLIGRGQMAAPGIANYGEILFSGGFTDIHAPIIGWSDSQMIITGGGTTTVFGDVEIKGGAELRISDFSNGVFFDHVQLRNGALLTGGGNAFFEGSLGIGDSPSRQEFNFNVTLGPTSNLLVEIAGVDPFLPEFDQYIFLKNLTLQGGALTLDLIGLNPGDLAYQPQLGDRFNVFEVQGQWTGQFGSYFLPVLGTGLEWNLSQLYSHGAIYVSQVIPEPTTALVLFLALAGLLSYRRRPDLGLASKP